MRWESTKYLEDQMEQATVSAREEIFGVVCGDIVRAAALLAAEYQ